MSNIGNKKTMSENLTRYINLSGKTKRALADEFGVAYSTFNDWTNGKKYPRIDKIEMMANYFGILKSDLIEEKKIGDIPEEADFHAKILMDKEVLKMLEKYYSLNDRDQQIIRNFVQGFVAEA